MCTLLSIQLVCDSFQLGYSPGYTPPRNVLKRRVALAIQPEMCIIQTLDQPVPTFQAVTAPRLD